jgi:ATP-dependent RNA circularization protein (DNA/RNA ligase family)
LDFYVFNIFDKNNKKKIDRVLAQEMCAKMGLKYVPVIAVNVLLLPTIEEMVKDSIGMSTLKDIKREGVVWRTDNQSISFKVINPVFLLGEQDEEPT